MADYKIEYHFTNGNKLTTFPVEKSDNIYDMVEELARERYQCTKNPDGSMDLVDMTQVCHVHLEKLEG